MQKKQQSYEIAERYCSHVDGNVVLSKINSSADEAPRYQCLSSHLCQGKDVKECKNHAENRGLK